jgi:hypothetical protein
MAIRKKEDPKNKHARTDQEEMSVQPLKENTNPVKPSVEHQPPALVKLHHPIFCAYRFIGPIRPEMVTLN